MEKSIITTGKTFELAVEAALTQLGLDRDSVSVELLESAKSGFLGIGASPAKVKVTYEVPDEAPAPALSSASRSPRKQAPRLPEQPKVPEQKPEQPRKQTPRLPEQPKAPEQPKKQAPKLPEQPKTPKAPQPPKEYASVEAGTREERIEQFVKGLLEHMGSDAVPHVISTEGDTVRVELAGEDLGILIGRRGETLDAIQHLTNYAMNHDANKRIRVSIDAENYRGKREDSLRRLAKKVAGKVVRYRKNITLEPMNAYERHVIHATLQDHPDVTTFSTGTEPNRRVIVAYGKDAKE